MICRVVYILIMCHLSELGDDMLNSYLLKRKKKKKKISYCTSLFIDVTKGSLHMVSEPVRPATWGSLRIDITNRFLVLFTSKISIAVLKG
jgi:hypothetical protein